MADRSLFVGWGQVVRGREERALEVFDETMGMYGRKQSEGKIESFDVMLLDPNGGLDGFITVKGTAAQIDALREDPEWRRNIADAQMIVDDMTIAHGVCNQGIADEMAMYRDAVAKVPQMT